MNIQYLKDIRSKYQVVFKDNLVYVIDHQNKLVSNYKSIQSFLEEYVSNLGTFSYFTRMRKLKRRSQLKNYHQRFKDL